MDVSDGEGTRSTPILISSSPLTPILSTSQVHITSRPPRPYKSLFTPSPSPAPRVRMSHVAVPPFPPGRSRSDYQRILQNKNRSSRNPTKSTSTPPKIKGTAARVDIARIPKDDVGVLSFHLRFLRQVVDSHQGPEHELSWAGTCEPSEPCWRRWTSPVCQSLSGTPEEKLSLGGPVEFSEEDDFEVKSEFGGMSIQEEKLQRQRPLVVATNGTVSHSNGRANSDQPVTSKNMPRIHTSAEISFSATTIGPAHSTLNSSFFLMQGSASPELSGYFESSNFDGGMMDPWTGHFPPLDTAPFGNGIISPSLFDGGMMDPWTAHSPPLDTAPFGDGTIDPSLISGSGPAIDIPFEPLLDSPPLSSASLESSPEPPAPSKSPASPKGAPFPSPRSALVSSSPSARVRTLRPYIQPPRIPNDMVSSADLQLSGSEDEASSDVPPVRKISRKKKQIPMPTLDQATPKPQDIKPIKSTRGMNWPRAPEYDYCHQCRSKSNVLKIFCACGRKFCVRCLSTRYHGEVVYDPNSATDFVCPACKDICTCDKCMPLRGEVYVPLRGTKTIGASAMLWSSSEDKSVAASEISETRPVWKRLGGKTNLPLSISRVSSEPTYTGPVAYLGAIYDLTGTKVGSAFEGTEPRSAFAGTNGEKVVVIRTLEKAFVQLEETREKEKKKRKKPRPRVYVGRLQPTWGFGDDVVTKDLEPIPWQDRNNGPHERFYVGNKAMLYKPCITGLDNLEGPWRHPPEMEAYDGFSSPLTSLEDEDDVAGVGESRQWPFRNMSDAGTVAQEELEVFVKKGPGKGFCANSLREVDVMRAITMGLLACGVGVKV